MCNQMYGAGMPTDYSTFWDSEIAVLWALISLSDYQITYYDNAVVIKK